ncbi:MAG: J domain-containing protein [Novosphingobium sp.]
MKVLLILALAIVACRLLVGRWPWDLLRPSGRVDDAARARRVLGLRDGASREEIVEAHRRLIATVHPDRGGSNEQVHEANAARDALLDRAPGTD